MAWTSSRLPTEGRFPSLAGATGWRHSPPLEPAGLREKVVLVDFCTFTCINWLRTLSYVRAWDQSYRDQGLVVIGLHTPEFSFGHDLENIRRALASMAIDYPIAVDNDYAVWDAFANHYWPALYFIDAEGSIRHHWFGEGDYERSEAVIQQLLRDAGVNDVGDELVAIDPVGPEVGGGLGQSRIPRDVPRHGEGAKLRLQESGWRPCRPAPVERYGLRSAWRRGPEPWRRRARCRFTSDPARSSSSGSPVSDRGVPLPA
jgi:hypothetical protein